MIFAPRLPLRQAPSRTLARLAPLAVAFAAAAGTAAFAEPRGSSEWGRVGSDRYGFELAYPASEFAPREGPASADGQVLLSHDGRARLLVGAFENQDGATLAEYRAQLLEDNYPGADIDYAPMRGRWFIVSGTQGDMHFYERVSFSCGGRVINSWALHYPVTERRKYDRIVEAIARSYSPGGRSSGACD